MRQLLICAIGWLDCNRQNKPVKVLISFSLYTAFISYMAV